MGADLKAGFIIMKAPKLMIVALIVGVAHSWPIVSASVQGLAQISIGLIDAADLCMGSKEEKMSISICVLYCI